MREILGVDIGGVIIERKPEGDDTSFFGARYLETPEVEGAIDAVAQLAEGRFAGRVHLVSKRWREILAEADEDVLARAPGTIYASDIADEAVAAAQANFEIM